MEIQTKIQEGGIGEAQGFWFFLLTFVNKW